MLGGSSALNGMIYVRGHRADYDGWAARGNDGWGYDDVLPLFKRSEDFDRGADEYHGAGGPLSVITRYEPHPLIAAVVAAAQEAGVPFNDDHNGAEPDGVGYAQLNIRDGRRHSVAEAFLRPVLGAPNLTVVTSARALRLLFEGTRCVGVEYVHGRRRASGAGRARGRRQRRDDRVAQAADALGDRPRGRARQRRHRGARRPSRRRARTCTTTCSRPSSSRRKDTVPPPLPGLQPLHAHLFARSRGGLARPDLQPLFFHLPLYAEDQDGPPDGFTLMGGLIRPVSRGSLRLASADPDAAPLLDPACLASDEDVEALTAAVELCREIGRPARALRSGCGRSSTPATASATATSCARTSAATRSPTTTRSAPAGWASTSWRSSTRSCGCTGSTGLRVADASVMPEVTTGNTHAPTVMIGERASDLVAAALGVHSRVEAVS